MKVVKVVTGEIRKLKTRMSKVEEVLKHIPKDITQLEDQLRELQRLIAFKERNSAIILKELREKEHELSNLKHKISAHDKKVSRKRSPREYESLVREREKLASKAMELSDEIARLRTEYDRLKAEETDMFTHQQELERELYRKRKEYGALLNELRGLAKLLDMKVREIEEKFNL